MGKTAQDRLLKRKLNELDQQTKKLKREIQRIRADKKAKHREGKRLRHSLEREKELEDLLQDSYETEDKTFEEMKAAVKEEKEVCDKCFTSDWTVVNAGIKIIMVCKECGRRKTKDKAA